MKFAQAVIGAAFGDEGKGLMVDYFALADTTVCRFNGGPQAGHTVTMANGRRHVFRHFGSGSFRGSQTYLSRYFISNPMRYVEELAQLRDFGVSPSVSADPDGLVTTPYDSMLNQMLEQHRGNTRHGSCGSGINETMQRSQHEEFKVTVWDLHNSAKFHKKLRNIRDLWVPQRVNDLQIAISDEYRGLIADNRIIDHYVADATTFYYSLTLLSQSLVHHNHIVFEGAQGLCLDQNHRFFPHVTHASTGLTNIMAMVEDSHISLLDVTYVTRAYATRHGAGPFPREVSGMHYRDETNVLNDWQGTLRFGHLDLDLLRESIENDLRHSRPTVTVRPHIAITCVNQVGDTVSYWYRDEQHTIQTKDLADCVAQAVGVPVHFLANGPTAKDVYAIGRIF